MRVDPTFGRLIQQRLIANEFSSLDGVLSGKGSCRSDDELEFAIL